MYKVIKGFLDLQDRNRVYNAGDEYPAKGIEVSEARIQELLSKNNKLGEPLIAEIKNSEVKAEPKEEPKEEVKEEPKEEAKPKKKIIRKKKEKE